MKKIYFTLTGTKYYYGKEFIEPGMKLLLVKEADNEIDHEAIQVLHEGLGKIGYVANSPYTVIGDYSYSAGRLYDKIEDSVDCSVELKLDKGVLCSVEVKDESDF